MVPVPAKYVRKEMGEIWDDQNKYELWREAEALVARAHARRGDCPERIPQFFEKYWSIDERAIENIDKSKDHDMNSFLEYGACVITEGMKRDGYTQEQIDEVLSWLHRGLTSYDIEDTALAVMLYDATKIIFNDLGALYDTLKDLSAKYANTPQTGRTHLQHAEPITFGWKLANWRERFFEHLAFLEGNRQFWQVGKISGAVGAYGQTDREIEAMVGEELGVRMPGFHGQLVNREGIALALNFLARIASTVSKCARDLEHLSSTEVQEVFETHGAGKEGSSAMPHKSIPEFANPNKCERIVSLARLVRMYAQVAAENIDTRHEQDLTQSANERIILPSAFILTDYMLDLFTQIVRDMRVDTRRMEENIWMSGGLIFSQNVANSLMEKGMPRKDARALVMRLCQKVVEQKQKQRECDFDDVCLDSEEVLQWLTLEEINDCFNVNKHLAYIHELLKNPT